MPGWLDRWLPRETEHDDSTLRAAAIAAARFPPSHPARRYLEWIASSRDGGSVESRSRTNLRFMSRLIVLPEGRSVVAAALRAVPDETAALLAVADREDPALARKLRRLR